MCGKLGLGQSVQSSETGNYFPHIPLQYLLHGKNYSTPLFLITIKLRIKYITVHFLHKYKEKRMNTDNSVTLQIIIIH
jgi:hypothetical protein